VLVVVDANAIISDYWLRSRRSTRLMARGRLELDQICVPRSVVAEAVKHFWLDLERLASSVSASRKLSRKLLPDRGDPEDVDVDAEVRSYTAYLTTTLNDSNASLDTPQIDAGELQIMAVHRRPPFKPDASGVVDAALWLMVKARAEKDDVALISDNHTDFGGNKSGGFHEHLVTALKEGAGSVHRYPTATEFHLAAGVHAPVYEEEILELLGRPEVVQELRRRILDLLDDPIAREAGLWGSIASPEVVTLAPGEVESINLQEVADAEPEVGYAVFTGIANVTYEIPVLQSEAGSGYEDGELDTVAGGDLHDPSPPRVAVCASS